MVKIVTRCRLQRLTQRGVIMRDRRPPYRVWPQRPWSARRNRWVVRPVGVRRLGLLVGAEGEAGGADVFPAVSGVNGSVPLAG